MLCFKQQKIDPKFFQKMHVNKAFDVRCNFKFNSNVKNSEINFRTILLHENCRQLCKTNNFAFLSENTYSGIQVTLTTVIEVMQFLCKECNYLFLMTSRLNQDALEVSYIQLLKYIKLAMHFSNIYILAQITKLFEVSYYYYFLNLILEIN